MSDRKESMDKACRILCIALENRGRFVNDAIEWLAARQLLQIKNVDCDNWHIAGYGWSVAYETLIDALAMAVIVCRKREVKIEKSPQS